MRYRRLDPNGDYTLGTGSDFYVDVPAAVAQAVKTRLLLLTGEWFVDTSDGTPWRTEVLGRQGFTGYDALIKARILGTPGVSSIASYSSSLDPVARALSVSATIKTIYGTATIDATL